MQLKYKLRIFWSKQENCLESWHPAGLFTNRDSKYLLSVMDSIEKELQDRGYDIKTLKFEISPNLKDFPSKFQEIINDENLSKK
jgi:hypothetical protein